MSLGHCVCVWICCHMWTAMYLHGNASALYSVFCIASCNVIPVPFFCPFGCLSCCLFAVYFMLWDHIVLLCIPCLLSIRYQRLLRRARTEDMSDMARLRALYTSGRFSALKLSFGMLPGRVHFTLAEESFSNIQPVGRQRSLCTWSWSEWWFSPSLSVFLAVVIQQEHMAFRSWFHLSCWMVGSHICFHYHLPWVWHNAHAFF